MHKKIYLKKTNHLKAFCVYSLSFDGIRNRVDDIIIGFSLKLTKDYFQISTEKKSVFRGVIPL